MEYFFLFFRENWLNPTNDNFSSRALPNSARNAFEVLFFNLRVRPHSKAIIRSFCGPFVCLPYRHPTHRFLQHFRERLRAVFDGPNIDRAVVSRYGISNQPPTGSRCWPLSAFKWRLRHVNLITARRVKFTLSTRDRTSDIIIIIIIIKTSYCCFRAVAWSAKRFRSCSVPCTITI